MMFRILLAEGKLNCNNRIAICFDRKTMSNKNKYLIKTSDRQEKYFLLVLIFRFLLQSVYLYRRTRGAHLETDSFLYRFSC